MVNKDLENALNEYYNVIKSERTAYKACYDSFLSSISEMPANNIKDLIKNICLYDIEKACQKYILSSKKATSPEAIYRFLSSIDLFYKNYLSKRVTKNEDLEKGCRRQEVVQHICDSLPKELKKKIMVPMKNSSKEKMNEIIQRLKHEKFIQLGQFIIYNLLTKYGFKEYIITKMKLKDINHEERRINLYNCADRNITVNIDDDDYNLILKYCEINPFKDRELLFTNSNGKKLTPSTIFTTLKSWAEKEDIKDFNPTTVSFIGISNLIDKGLDFPMIMYITGYTGQKIVDVWEYNMLAIDVNEIINSKL